jgi:CubicO group peptidase (beta-lactamase class C family)
MRAHHFLILCLSLFPITLFAQGQKTTYSKDVQQKITTVEQNLSAWVQVEGQPKWSLAERMKKHNIKGVSVAVIKDYKIEWVKAYGWADEGEKRMVTPQTLFQAGSISKSLNGVGLVKLVQDKKVDLNADINSYLISWKFPYDSLTKGKTINLANLLSHTAGLSVHGFPGYEVSDSLPSLPQILDGARPANTKAVRSLFEPGLQFKYSGGGTTISQLLLTDVVKQPYDVFMWEQVLQPLGMTHSTYTQPLQKDTLKTYATAYYEDGREVKGKYHLYPEQAAAGLWTTPTDIGKYIIETQLSLAGKSKKVLSPEMTKLRLTPYVDKASALGVFILEKEGTRYFSHNGQDEGFTASYYGSFDGNGVVVMSNSNSSALNAEIINSVGIVYKWAGLTPQVKKVVPVPDSLLSKYIGTYQVENDTLIISRKDQGLIMRIKNTPIEWQLNFTNDTSFFVLEMPGEFAAILMGQDKVTTMVLKQGSSELNIKRIE